MLEYSYGGKMKPGRNVGIHESFFRDEPRSSNRTFGFVFAAFFLVLGLGPILRGQPERLWALLIAAIFLAISLTVPELLRPLNALWTKLGMRLQKVSNPIVMGLLFLSTFAPIGLFMRLLNHDPLHLRWDRDAKSYWIARTPPGPQPESMKDQF